MAMKLTTRQQEMLDGKLGEAKKFCMEKLTDFGKAVGATEMVDLVLVLNCCPIYSKDRRNAETKKKLEMYDLGHSALYDPIFAMKDAHVADETGMQCGNDPYLVQFDKVEEAMRNGLSVIDESLEETVAIMREARQNVGR